MGKPEGKTTCITVFKWKDNIKIDLSKDDGRVWMNKLGSG
jgi:hypothetical protein